MAKKIEWTETAIHDRFRIYYYWLQRNKSDSYSKKLEIIFKEASILISEFPEIGKQTDLPNLRFKIIKDYKLFYISNPDSIQIIRIWDTRQDPDNLEL
jgi:toxin YoeB